MSGFDSAYLGTPPWDIDGPQPEIAQLEEQGALRGAVLDCGCGTGENALYLAGCGHDVWGVDSSPRAIRKAESKARERSVAAKFLVLDVLDLGSLGRTFDCITDCGLFHVFSDEDRRRYVSSLGSVTVPGSRLVILCFSDLQPGDSGPRRVSKTEIQNSFKVGWKVSDIRPAAFRTNMPGESVKAWLSEIVRG
jgi:cyclopropane fatty-acyl-phospholipid synthase-like methyltransferase